MKLYEIPFTPAYSDVTRITSFNGVKEGANKFLI